MSYDAMSQFYSCLNLPITERLLEITRIIDNTNHFKDLQAMFPQLINNIFSPSYNSGWGLRTITLDNGRNLFELLISFLEPQGPMFRLCYKLLSDPSLKYNLSLSMLPRNLQVCIESGRCPQFYADMIYVDPQAMNIAALALNPFDYYIFNFALHLVHNNENKSSWENWNSVYFALACDYLMHFLPSDPNIQILPIIHNYSGKVPMAAPLQTANRPMCSPSLLLIPDLSGISNQHTSQNQSRNEIWRSETILQVFIDIWMCVEDTNPTNLEMYQRNYMAVTSSPERVRTVRVLVKHIHSYSAKHLSDPAINSSELRKYARKIVCTRGYHYIKHLVTTWPLDASFRLVMELWLSLIQPWRYTNNNINQDRFPSTHMYQEEGSTCALDASYVQFIAENYPTYTCIFQLVLPRFMRLDLTAYKNAVMLFRLGKVFSQQHLVSILKELEEAICDSNTGGYNSPDTSWNRIGFDQSYNNNSMSTNKWVAVAKQALTELNLSTTFRYEPIWKDNNNKYFVQDFIRRIVTARNMAEKNIEEQCKRNASENQGLWSSIKSWLMIENTDGEQLSLDECKKVPTYLAAAIHHFSHIFDLSEISVSQTELVDDSSLEQTLNNTNFNLSMSITSKLRSKHTNILYMGDPDLMPITSYENTIIVRILYQIAHRLNEIYGEEFSSLWNRTDFLGYIAKEVLQKPITIQSYVKDTTNHQHIVRQNLPARLSFRKLGSYKYIVWFCIGYCIFKMFSYNGFTYLFSLVGIYVLFITIKATLKALNIV